MSKFFLILLAMVSISCHSPKRIYIGNETGTPLTITINRAIKFGENSVGAAFQDSLNERKIVSGHITINYGHGKWSKADEEILQRVLSEATITCDGGRTSSTLAKDIKIGRGILIPELIVKIKHPDKR